MKTIIALILMLPMAAMADQNANNAAAAFALGMSQQVQRHYAPQYNYDPRYDYQYQQQLLQERRLMIEQERYLAEARRQMQNEQTQRSIDVLNGNQPRNKDWPGLND